MSTETYEYEKINAKDKPIAEDFVYVYSEIEDGGFRKVSKAMLKVLLGVATKLSELENDKEFITKTVSDLENYYLKSETYSKDEIDNRISLIPRFDVQVVSSLPTTDISETTVYLVSSGDDSDNLYTEYINVNGLWEILGTQKIASVENAVLYTAQSLTEEQKTQARTNISAASSEEVRQLEEQIADQNARISEAVDSEFENEKGNIVQLIIDELQGLPVFGVVDENNTITVTSQLSAGTYTLKYENEDGTLTDVGTITIEEGEVPIINLLSTALTPDDITTVFDGIGYKNGYYASAAEPFYNTDSAFFCSGLMVIPEHRTFYVKGCIIDTSLSHTRFGLMLEDGSLVNTATLGNWGDVFTVTELGTQYYSISIKSDYAYNGNTPYYFYFSASGTGDNVVVATTPIS